MKRENINCEFLDRVTRGEIQDHWYHYGIASSDPALAALRDVQAVIVAGSGERTAKFAEIWAKKRDAPIYAFPKEERFVFRYVDKVIFSSHGMGMPSAAIAMHELMKMTYFLKDGKSAELDRIFWMRVGTSGGLGLPGGSVVVSTEGLQADLKPYRLLVQGEETQFSGKFPPQAAARLAMVAEKIGVHAVLGKTVGCNDFYLEQGRLDGAINLMNEAKKLNWLQGLYDHGVRNMEMETPMLAGLLNHWGFPDFAAVCTVLLDRLKGDQIEATSDELCQYTANAEKILFACLEGIIV